MSDRVYPSAKPTAPAAAVVSGGTTAAPAKLQLYNPNRHPYRPNPIPHRHRRSRSGYLCCCCFWTTLTLILIVLIASIAACAAYLIYSPRRPAFSVAAARISQFNLITAADGTTHLSSAVNLTVTAKNPNKKQITYSYDPISIFIYSNDALIVNGSLPSFVSYPNDTPKILLAKLSSTSALIDVDWVAGLRSDLKRKNGLPLKIEIDTDVVVKMGKFKTKKVGIRVICEDIKGILPKGKSVSSSSTTNAKCMVDIRIKVWKFTF